MYKHYIFILLFLFSGWTFAQESNDYREKLDALSTEINAYNKTMQVEISGIALYDFISAIADEHKLSVDVDTALDQLISSNFYDVPVKDVLLFLIGKHDLEMDVKGKILVIRKKEIIPEIPKIIPLKKIDVSYNKENDFLSVKLKKDSIAKVAQAITDASQKNIILSPSIKKQTISAYILNRPFDQVLEMMAKSNNLMITKDENDFYYIDKSDIIIKDNPTTKKSGRKKSTQKKNGTLTNNGEYSLAIDKKGFLSVNAFEADVLSILVEAAEKLNINYFMYDKPEKVTTTLLATGITFEELLRNVLKGKEYTYKKVDEVFLIGKHDTDGIRKTILIQMENRTIESVKATFPKALVQKMDIVEFVELNGFVVTGSDIQVRAMREFLREIDKVVPNIEIEVMIVQYQKGYEIQTGFQAGLDDNKRTTSGVLFPTTDVQANANSVNGLIDAFNGLGIVNLGKVTERFYLSLKMLENNSYIKVESTPKLVTLNGHEATTSIGETSYYFEQQNQLVPTGGINNNILQSGTWKSTEANLSVRIKPFVSKDEHVTLEISVEQSSFLGRAGENAPPGKATRKFESMIRVKNNEMILLGGLDELENENSGTGTPFFSRIPVIKWFFSSRKKKKEKSKLHILIKPTVTY
ncbi:type II and III secretion system protein [Kordia sp. YSTF-M3]|uniref:Type II and III secretion system protein n=1 Tax=Kordia aestuariivivens TaxID=2759037 RepID=A0ABR7QBT7_9FLAO|nr:type II and III secretion system protein [Kordia aestuariivivens]MBC8756047.1 type II and III secretion system protein [Kordia aestuariivivens]